MIEQIKRKIKFNNKKEKYIRKIKLLLHQHLELD